MSSKDASAKYRDQNGPRSRKPVSRRTPPAESKSLPAHIKKELARANIPSAQAQDPSKQKASQIYKQDTQDSNGSDESAAKWFDKANERGPQGQRESPSNNEPPFFLGNQKNYFPNNFVSSGSDDELFGVEHLDNSENEDLRGVIDDLTVENKRLKLLLKSTRSRPSPSASEAPAQDRLFDVRVHGLSTDKKRELENLLRSFATGVRTSSNTASASSANRGSAQPQTLSEGSSSSLPHSSNGKVRPSAPDSGYGTNSTSGHTSANASHGALSVPQSSRNTKARNIHNYLHDIPDTLLPRHSLYMSKRAKMGLVVRRLENLFTGRQAGPGDHSQPHQQQEVSHSAAFADDPMHGAGRSEGTREAHMLPLDTKVNLDAEDRRNASPPSKKPKLNPEASERLTVDGSVAPSTSHASSPREQQRPTRPLDLDIHRAQVAAENIHYLHHLGMASPLVQGTMKPSPWIYLNLLISMAQLHTVNVTPAFIRQAIRKFSTKLEISADGHKVRWNGGSEGTTFSKDDERAMELVHPSPSESQEETGGNSSKRSKTNSSSNAMISEEPSSENITSGQQTSATSKQMVSTAATSNMLAGSTGKTKTSGTPFDYKPLVYKGKRYSPAVSYLDSSGSPCSHSNDSSGLVYALSKSNLNQRRNSDDGMITFYQNPYFCTDLSADNAPVNWIPQRKALPWDTLGLQRDYIGESPLRHHDSCYYAPQFAPEPYPDEASEPLMSLDLQKLQTSGEDETVPRELPVCGIGGVIPDDNFALDVKVIRHRAKQTQAKRLSPIPLTRTRKRKHFEYEVEECDHLELQPSRLPPPSYVFFPSSSSSADREDGDGYDSDESSSEVMELNPPPPAFLHQWSTESDDEFDDDGSSVDMLEMARAADPDRLAAQEREYLINQNIGRRLEGSLAATVGASRTGSSQPHSSELSEAVDQASVDSMDVDRDSDDDDNNDE
ncbi:uncharacterized protein HMPREF1541_02264 [Cyphellophora europaea CBS 101466]|uniref:Frequency clock protein n=1 Tax=Cyphellophora europaea (strain CBS 101466) TaxID=1220924 RepID=W2S316_CYPE1|nr:uncharacterized protein HMPREF1541_02264 [Cyphellophora europaea CBS 101466]ETN43106.1 hypothetical protein HMPREF1541_02264 [Cyphellophora europaea CBS 101466]